MHKHWRPGTMKTLVEDRAPARFLMNYYAPLDHSPRSVPVLFLAVFASVLALIISLAACTPAMAPQVGGAGSEVIMLTMEDKGTAISVRQGDVIQVELERAGSTGYVWHLDEGCQDHFELLSQEEAQRSSEKTRLGGPVIQRWQLQATAQGKTELVLHLYRQWEGKEQSADRFEIAVTIE